MGKGEGEAREFSQVSMLTTSTEGECAGRYGDGVRMELGLPQMVVPSRVNRERPREANQTF
jgi:hypothetical protein